MLTSGLTHNSLWPWWHIQINSGLQSTKTCMINSVTADDLVLTCSGFTGYTRDIYQFSINIITQTHGSYQPIPTAPCAAERWPTPVSTKSLQTDGRPVPFMFLLIDQWIQHHVTEYYINPCMPCLERYLQYIRHVFALFTPLRVSMAYIRHHQTWLIIRYSQNSLDVEIRGLHRGPGAAHKTPAHLQAPLSHLFTYTFHGILPIVCLLTY